MSICRRIEHLSRYSVLASHPCSSKYLFAEVKAEEVCLPLGLDKHQRPLLGIAAVLIEDADELVLLLVLGNSILNPTVAEVYLTDPG